MPWPFPTLGAASFPSPYLGVPPVGAPLTPVPYQGLPQMGAPLTPPPYLGVPPLMASPVPTPYLGVAPQPLAPLGAPFTPSPYLGVPPVGAPFTPTPFVGAPLAPAPFLSVPPLPIAPTPWPAPAHGVLAVSPVVAMLLAQLGLREAAARIGDEALKQRVIAGINDTLDRTIEGVTGLSLQTWFGPGAEYQLYPVVAELGLLAHRYPEGPVRTALLTIAGQILHKSLTSAEDGGSHRHK
jgi:hypothetical protein